MNEEASVMENDEIKFDIRPFIIFNKNLRNNKGKKSISYIKYSILYSLIGITLFGLSIGILCTLFGVFLDCYDNKILKKRQLYSEKDEVYKKYESSFLFQDYIKFIFLMSGSVLVLLFFYSAFIQFSGNNFVVRWIEFTNVLSIKVASIVPLVNKINEFGKQDGYLELSRKMSHLFSVSWFFVLMLIPYYSYKLIILTANIKHWETRENYFGNKSLHAKQIFFFLFFMGLISLFLNQSFFRDIQDLKGMESGIILLVHVPQLVFMTGFLLSLVVLIFVNNVVHKRF
ncbi:MAG: hypothetical protein PQ612_09625 [Rickettsiales bacterium]|nr:hypothetical protein [Pseudomonadota bacterium]MDA0966053.1 hypothetical protein [Pseudomonadota bacterium]MDG4544235.1 hypothetical protein [Rickettsiales bacterium]MDG4546414.1 hypothetical protein [Rickettsiales bacterium]MDG4548559.1 hypothetical protein [Rickettsiales bacterium]